MVQVSRELFMAFVAAKPRTLQIYLHKVGTCCPWSPGGSNATSARGATAAPRCAPAQRGPLMFPSA